MQSKFMWSQSSNDQYSVTLPFEKKREFLCEQVASCTCTYLAHSCQNLDSVGRFYDFTLRFSQFFFNKKKAEALLIPLSMRT